MKENEPVGQFEIGPMNNFVYLVLDWKSREAAIVDPQKDLTGPLSALKAHGFRLTQVLLTHTHHDHVGGLPELVRMHPDIPIVLHEMDAHRLQPDVKTSGRIAPMRDGEEFRIGSLTLRAFHTPGHSAGALTYLLEGEPPYLFTGDTIFIRDCGRTDLPTGDTRQMFETLQRFKSFPPEAVVLPGHHYAPECASTLASEFAESGPFLCKSAEELSLLP